MIAHSAVSLEAAAVVEAEEEELEKVLTSESSSK
jgi:hypothetical protein